MAELSGFPSQEIEFTKAGEVHDQAQVDAALEMVAAKDLTDVVIISHGWNNDTEEARELYEKFFASLRSVLGEAAFGELADREIGIVGVLWPSKKFTEKEVQPGGGASLGGAVSDANLKSQLEDLKGFFDAANADQLLDSAALLAGDLEDRASSRREFVSAVVQLLGDRDSLDAELLEEIPEQLFSLDGDVLIDRLSAPGPLEPPIGDDATGGAAGLGDLFGGIKAGASRLLNLLTYFKMKMRAGVVGEGGLHDFIIRLRNECRTTKVHLVGHSFGGRLVVAALKGGGDGPGVKVDSLSLLQAAFSHNGFAASELFGQDGYFRDVVEEDRVEGPTIITHTANDKAVGVAYPLASRLGGDIAAGLGDRNDKFGAIGRNGAQHANEAEDLNLGDLSGAVLVNGKKLFNLLADKQIQDHGDIHNPDVARAVALAMATT